MVNLYLSDGTKILTVGIGMVNYELFCDVLRKKCPETVAKRKNIAERSEIHTAYLSTSERSAWMTMM
mgnify:CR=1 FL=1